MQNPMKNLSDKPDTNIFVLRPGAPSLPGVRMDARWRVPVFKGRRLPKALVPYAAPVFSWEWMIQDVLNGRLPPPPVTREGPVLRPYQNGPVRLMREAHASGAPGFLLAYPTGSGKTAMSICATHDLPDAGTVLVVTKLDVVPAWRRAISHFGSGGKRWVVINPEQLWRLFVHPVWHLNSLPVDRAAELAAQGGVLSIPFDVVIVDESHMLASPASLRSRTVRRLLLPAHGTNRRPWFLRVSASPFSHPMETGYLGDLLAHAAGVEAPGVLGRSDYQAWLSRLGFALNTDRERRWTHDLNLDDVKRVDYLLFSQGVGATATAQELGLPFMTRELRPVELPPGDQARYESAWSEFRAHHGLEVSDSALDGTSEVLRRVQKASLLKAPQVAKIVAGLVEDGYQVVVPAWYLDSVSAIARHTAVELKARGLPDRVVEITGADRHLRERKRQLFQGGQALVAVTNSLEGVNFQAGERGGAGAGKDATQTPRACVVADVLTGGKRALQAEGRTHRDGQRSLILYVYAANTTEEEWLARMLRATAGTQALVQSPEEARALMDLATQLTGAADGEPDQ
ncbi:DEAD/DEAH box helicase family protein [Streptomyces sp. NBC_00987]|uniref:DEAD/DEAH box helicase family protein n=2 Tax=unclassified Streptomyces TaxID=2593676 RepID=UPI00386C7D8B